MVVRHRQTHTDSDCYTDSDSTAECDAHRNTKAYSDAEVSSHASASPVDQLRFRFRGCPDSQAYRSVVLPRRR